MVKVEKKIFPKKKLTGKKSDRRSEIVARRAAILGGMSLTY